jgi:hypothetical protein
MNMFVLSSARTVTRLNLDRFFSIGGPMQMINLPYINTVKADTNWLMSPPQTI